MIASELLSKHIVPLRTSETGAEALAIMGDFLVKHLPIVNNQELLGLLSEDDILNHDVEEPIGSYALSLYRPYVFRSAHIYEVLSLMSENNLTIVPVIDEEKSYLGLITQEELLHYFARTASFTEPGAIIVLEINRHDYSLSEIARIVESENAAVISCFITSSINSTRIDVTLKVNRQEVQAILATFERFDYMIKASFFETELFDSLRERYDSLMHYLNV